MIIVKNEIENIFSLWYKIKAYDDCRHISRR